MISEADRAEVLRRAAAADAASAATAETPAPARKSRASVLGGPTKRGRAGTPPVAPEDRTAVLPKIPQDQPDHSRRLPKSWRVAKPRSDESVQDKVPDWLFRPEDGSVPPAPPAVPPVERTREMPVIDPDASAAAQRGARYDWAEETPLDDLPSLTDELLGSRDEWSQWDGGDGGDGENPPPAAGSNKPKPKPRR